MSDNSLAQDAQAVDVTNPETHYQVQCADVRLVSSHLSLIEADSNEEQESRFVFKIKVAVHGAIAFAQLQVEVIAITSENDEPPSGCELQFIMVGEFTAEDEIQPAALGDFARMYSLSILWPYAREYTSDQLRRAGLPFSALPIINPQVVTEKLIEGGLVEVEVIETSDRSEKLSFHS